MIDLRNAINRKELPENEIPNKIVDIVQKFCGFSKQQKGKGCPLDLAKHIYILTPKQML